MSNMRELDNLRHAEVRGKILTLLAEDYISNMTSVGTLVSALDLAGFSLREESISWHLRYLEDSAFVKLWRTRDMPGYRRDRLSSDASPEDIRFARLLPKGLHLVDGEREEDPKVKF